MKIVIDDKIPFVRGALEPYAEVVYLPGAEINSYAISDADALIVRTRTKCDCKLLAGSKVQIVVTATIGFDHIKQDDLSKLGILWFNAPGCNADSVKNYITSALISQTRTVAGLTLGIVGAGHVGSKVAQIGKALGMRVLINDPPRAEIEGKEEFVSLEYIAKEADIITLHVPLEQRGKYPTVNLIGKDFIDQLKHRAVLFNSCRGEAVDPEAIKSARCSGKLSGVLIDVWPNEPNIDLDLLDCVDIGTSHIAGYSIEGKANGSTMAIRTVAKHFNINELLNWQPEVLPPPRFAADIILDEHLSFLEQIRFAVLHAYNIREDDLALRKDPDKFEFLRGAYPVRREFSAFSIIGGVSEARMCLSELGFKLK